MERVIDIDFQDQNGNTLLMHAAKSKNTQMIKKLIAAGANLNLRNRRRFTALMIACAYNYYEIANLLINAGADINFRNISGDTAYTLGDEITKSLIKNRLVRKAIKDKFNKRKLLRLTQSGKLPTEMYTEIGKFLFGRRKYSRY